MRSMLPLACAAVLGSFVSVRGVGAQSASASTRAADRSGPAAAEHPDDLLGSFSLTSHKGPVTIKADKLEFDYKTRVLTYRGTVTVTQEDITLTSDLLRVTLDPKASESVREIVAEGAVQINKGDRQATGGRAVFDQAARTVTLSDRAKLRDGPNEVAGERVVVYLDEERSVVDGGSERVRAVLFPSSTKGGADAHGKSADKSATKSAKSADRAQEPAEHPNEQ
jgi:lipopolysaccharide export system protein LptA